MQDIKKNIFLLIIVLSSRDSSQTTELSFFLEATAVLKSKCQKLMYDVNC